MFMFWFRVLEYFFIYLLAREWKLINRKKKNNDKNILYYKNTIFFREWHAIGKGELA